ncbi:AAA family ATPase [Thermodesulforhabdus norvegica]|uniref:Exonuclease SbcC n=1 Tax=Thermodesulforhabdus norvegica TaxID=39841 RepID=A0A1I4UX80_9BACT|nr:AAA family ATPase [Thermodesulforhabdus norvegica]SFM93518.1 exonuclease SbcC [Thermodesulforhabdus norvegica]
MIRKIAIRNFMSHKDTVVELSDGVTVISGPNNVGKSALVEAIRCVCENPPAAFVLRHGAVKAVVEIELASGEVIRWERKQGSSVYRIIGPDGKEQVYAKTRRVPEDVQRLLRMGPVETDGGRLDVHLAHQKDPIFLLDESGSKIAGFFAASSEAEYLIRMRQALKDKARFYRGKKSDLEREVELCESLLKAYKPLDRVEQELARCSITYEKILERERKIEELQALITEVERLKEKVDECLNQENLLSRLREPPEVSNTGELALMVSELDRLSLKSDTLFREIDLLKSVSSPPELKDSTLLAAFIGEMNELEKRLGFIERVLEHLNRLEAPPDLIETSSLDSLCFEMDELERREERLINFLKVCSTLRDLPEFKPPDPLYQTVKELKALVDRERNLENLISALDVLTSPPEIRDVKALVDFVDELESLAGRVRDLDRVLAECDERLVSKREEIARYLREIGVCPVCRQVIDLEHFLQETHDD